MNRVIAMLILGVLLTAMVLIVANYMSRPDMPENYVQEEVAPVQAEPAPQKEAEPEQTDLRSMLQKPVTAPEEAVEAVDGGLPQPEPVTPGIQEPAVQQNASVPVPPVVTQPVPDMKAQVAAQPEAEQKPAETVGKNPAVEDAATEKAKAEKTVAEKPTAASVSKQAAPVAVAKTSAQKSAAGGALTMESAGYRFDGSKLIFYVKGSASFTHKMFTLAKPDRLVIDVKGAWKGVQTPKTPSNRLVKATRSGVYKDYVRYVLDLKAPLVSYSAIMQGNELVVIMD